MRLVEFQDFDYKIEEDVQGRPLRVSGVFQKIGEKNSNARIYPKDLWEKVLNDEKTQRRLKERRVLGELDHPKDGKTQLLRAAMVITDLGIGEDGFVRGVYEVLNTPSGQVLKELHRAGVRLGISSRGDGDVEPRKEGQVVVPESYRFDTFDVVLDPSVEEAYPTVLKEAIQSARELEEKIYSESLPALVERFENLSKQVQEACARQLPPKKQAEGVQETESKETTPMDVKESQEYKDLQARLGKVESDFAAEKKRADAATATAEELLIQAKTAQWNAGHMKESLDQARSLNERYETAKSIIEEMAEELRNSRAIWQETKALRKVATAMYEYFADSKLADRIRGLLAGVPKAVREAVMPIVEKCQSEEEVQAIVAPLVEQLQKLQPEKPQAKKDEKDPAVPSKKELQERHGEVGKPLANDKTAPQPEKDTKDGYVPNPSNGRAIHTMTAGRAAAIALTKSLVESRKRHGF